MIMLLQLLPAQAKASDFSTWLTGFKAEAINKGITPQTFAMAFNGVVPDPRVIELDKKQPERTKMPFSTYLRNVVSQKRIDDGRAHFLSNRQSLTAIETSYGVPASIAVALWGVETSYGTNTGGFDIIRSLATLAWEGRRAAFFKNELLNALFILQGNHVSRPNFKGSWAGAMGQNQFMPSSWSAFAVDGDGDGSKNIWNSKKDVFASTANYLAQSGWNQALKWGWSVELPDNFAPKHTRKSVIEWMKEGVKFTSGMPNIESHTSLSLVIPDGGEGRAYLVSENYDVIKKWNRSTSFALSVGLLSDYIAKPSALSSKLHLNP